MGCVEKESAAVTSDMLKAQLRKIKYSLDIKKQRIDKERLKGEEPQPIRTSQTLTANTRAGGAPIESEMPTGVAHLMLHRFVLFFQIILNYINYCSLSYE